MRKRNERIVLPIKKVQAHSKPPMKKKRNSISVMQQILEENNYANFIQPFD